MIAQLQIIIDKYEVMIPIDSITAKELVALFKTNMQQCHLRVWEDTCVDKKS